MSTGHKEVTQRGPWSVDAAALERRERERVNQWRQAPPDNECKIACSPWGKGFLPEAYVALALTHTVWQVPAYLKYDRWNDSPLAEKQVALLRHRDTIYGMDVVDMSYDTIEVCAARLPTSREEALRLAEEYFAYSPACLPKRPDNTIEAAAAILMGSTALGFW